MNDLQVRFSELPLEMQKDVERAIEKREQQVKEAALDKLREKGIVHLDPTYDRTFKWLMSDENGNIAKAIFDSLVFLAYKGLETREVKDFQSMSTKFDKMTEQLKHQSGSQFQALTMDVPADLDLGEVGTDMPAEEPRHDLDSAVDDIVKTLQGLPADKNISVRKELIEKLEGLKVLGARIEEKDIGEVVSILQKRRDVWVDIGDATGRAR